MYTTGLFQTGRTALCGCQQQPRRVHARAGRRCLTVRAATAVPAEVSVQKRESDLFAGLIAKSRASCCYCSAAVQDSISGW